MRKSILLIILSISFFSTQAQWKKTTMFDGGEIQSLYAESGTVYACTTKGIFTTTDNGVVWNAKNNGLTNLSVNSLTINNNYIFAGTDGGVFISSDNCENWNPSLNLENSSTINVQSLTNKEGKIFASTNYKGIYMTDDNGENWTKKNNGLSSLRGKCISNSDDNIYFGTYDKGIFYSNDDGENWNDLSSGLSDLHIISIATEGDSVFVSTLTDGIFKSTDKGQHWKKINGEIENKLVRAFEIVDNNIFASVYYGGSGNGIYQSSDYGETWTKINKGLSIYKITSVCASRDNIFIGDRYGWVYIQAKSKLTLSESNFEIGESNSVELYQNFPNPFKNSTTIKYKIPQSVITTKVELKVYDVLGCLVTTLLNKNESGGDYTLKFNSSNLASGVYYYKLEVNNHTFVKRMIIED